GRFQTARVDERRPRRRQKNLTWSLAQKFEQERRPRQVELARYVVEQEDRMNAARLGDARELGELQSHRDGTVLALRRVGAHVVASEPNHDVVAMRAFSRAAAVPVALPARAQRFGEDGLVVRPTGGVGRGELALLVGDARERPLELGQKELEREAP